MFFTEILAFRKVTHGDSQGHERATEGRETRELILELWGDGCASFLTKGPGGQTQPIVSRAARRGFVYMDGGKGVLII